jgi:hypothetical protein
MYGLWILVIIFGSVGVASLAFGIIPKVLDNYYSKKLKYKYVAHYYNQECMETTTFYGWESDLRHLGQEEFDRYNKIFKKQKICDKLGDVCDFFRFIGIILLIIALFIAIFAVSVPIGSRQEVAYWENFVEMVETTLDSENNEYETIGIAGKIIEYNSWLTQARTSQEFYGIWSSYFGIDLSQLEYIKIGQ